jgi:hypothetical protein
MAMEKKEKKEKNLQPRRAALSATRPLKEAKKK